MKMNRIKGSPALFIATGLLLVGVLCSASYSEDWGFWGHRKINKMAVFTLPNEMFPLFKKELAYLEAHAVDPDKRRYATKFEAVRHYIDIDHWGENPFEVVPRQLDQAVMKYGEWKVVDSDNDTTTYQLGKHHLEEYSCICNETDTLLVAKNQSMLWFYRTQVMSQYYEDEISVPRDSIDSFLEVYIPSNLVTFDFEDKFSGYGILPYHLMTHYQRLIKAFESRDKATILRHAADIGHYVGDAHVPLHTTENYNGQLTNQIGIHAFWESRLPELFADREYDYVVGKATIISDPESYFWDMVEESHSHLDSVLAIERRLVKTFDEDQQWCYDNRLNRTIRIQCEEFSKAYHEEMDGMVEDRMRKAIQAIGSVWYSAWVEAGQPDLSNLGGEAPIEEEIKADPSIKTRDHSF